MVFIKLTAQENIHKNFPNMGFNYMGRKFPGKLQLDRYEVYFITVNATALIKTEFNFVCFFLKHIIDGIISECCSKCFKNIEA